MEEFLIYGSLTSSKDSKICFQASTACLLLFCWCDFLCKLAKFRSLSRDKGTQGWLPGFPQN